MCHFDKMLKEKVPIPEQFIELTKQDAMKSMAEMLPPEAIKEISNMKPKELLTKLVITPDFSFYRKGKFSLQILSQMFMYPTTVLIGML